jgi:hypothetical protein
MAADAETKTGKIDLPGAQTHYHVVEFVSRREKDSGFLFPLLLIALGAAVVSVLATRYLEGADDRR